MVSFSLAKNVAVVTGAPRRIRKTIALALAEAGADIVVCNLILVRTRFGMS